MVRVAERSHLTADEYLAWERQQPVKHEFFHGEVFAMAGGSMRHNALCGRLVIEVLSESTEQYDRGLKWDGYQRIESLTDYVLVSQAEARIEHFRRDRNRTWIYQLAGVGERLTLSSGVELDVDAIFAGVMQLPGD